MKTIGLIGGMSWESTQTYYQIINQTVREQLGGFHSAECLIYSVDFHNIEVLQQAGEWDKAGEILADIALRLQNAGADLLVLCTNTMHKVAPYIEKAISIPFLHIATMTANALEVKGITQVGLLGTRYTMEQDFYKQELINHGIDVVIPNPEQCHEMNRIIFDELCMGKIKTESKQAVLKMIHDMEHTSQVQAVILGCTEIGLLIQQSDMKLPVFDTTLIHAKTAAITAIQ